MCKVERIGLPAPDNCLGCSACVAACARGALNLEQDERGFYRPSVGFALVAALALGHVLLLVRQPHDAGL